MFRETEKRGEGERGKREREREKDNIHYKGTYADQPISSSFRIINANMI